MSEQTPSPPSSPRCEEALLRRLIGGDPSAEQEVRAAADQTDSLEVLVAAAVLTRTVEPLDRAGRLGTTSRDRQLVALARAHLVAPEDHFDGLVRDYLASHPDQLLAAWMATRH